MKVLFVDDEPDILEQAKIFLEREVDEISVETASSAEEALNWMEENDYDAVVSDYRMPGMDGLEFLEVIRKDRNSDIPFIIFTGRGREEVAIKALNLGANLYLRKGGDPRSQYGVLAQGIVREVERRELRRGLRESEKKYREVFSRTHDAMWVVDVRDGEFVYEEINPKYCEFSGLGEGEVVGKNLDELFSPETAGKIREGYEKVLEGKEPVEVEQELVFSGEKKWHLTSLSPILDEDGNVDKIAGSGKDITEQKQAEANLRRFEEAVQSSGDSIYLIDKDFRYIFANDEHISRLAEDGKIPRESVDEVVGRNYGDIHPEEELQALEEKIEKLVESGESLSEEYKFLRKDKWSSRTYSPVKDPGTGEVEGVVVVSKDITERKEMEEILREYKMAVGGSEDLMAACDEDYRYTFANDAYLEYHGQDRGGLEGKKLKDVLGVEAFEQEVKPWVYRCLKGERIQYQMKREHPDMGERTLDISYYPLRSEGEIHGVVTVMRDITERKEMEEKLRASEERFRGFFENLGDAVFVTKVCGDNYGRILEANPAAEEQTGYSREELIGMDIVHDLSAMLAEEGDLSYYDEWDEKLASGESVTALDKKRRKDGSEYWTEVLTTPIEYEGEKACLSINRDITERKEAEERKDFLHSLLRHDVRNKLQVAEGYLELLADTRLLEEQRQALEKGLRALAAGDDLIEKVGMLRKIDLAGEKRKVDLDRMIKKAITHNEGAAEERGVRISYGATDAKVMAGPLLVELFSNLMENSIRHSGGKEVRISAGERDGKHVVSVEDDGKGIRDELKDKIFEASYAGKDSRGSGLGLHLVKRIAERYGGGVEVKDSELGGARFDVYLEKAR